MYPLLKTDDPSIAVPNIPRHRANTLLIAADVSKTFRGVAAVKNVTFELRAGEVHGLVGANGAGKSTFTRILAGAEQADSGSISLEGRVITPASPRDGRQAGVAAIYQELSLVPGMSALSNVFLGQSIRKGPLVDVGAMRQRYDEMCAWMGLKIPANARANSLSIADQQMVEIMRAMQGQNKVLIMDEPTAPIGPRERTKLYDLMKQLTQVGTGLIFISHDLDEVLAHCDRISIMRDGELIDTREGANWTKAELVEAMLGTVETSSGTVRSRYGPDLLSVRELSVPGRIFNAAFSVRAGEILGIAGLVGSGRTELLQAIAGADPKARGKVSIKHGSEISLPLTVPKALSAGIVLVPEDRKRQGLVHKRASLVNMTLPSLRGLSRFGALSTLMSVGGGIFFVSMFSMLGWPMLKAVATSSGFGPVIAIPALLGYIYAGFGSSDLPAYSLGYVNYLAAAIIAPLSVLTAPLGVRVAHRIPQRALELAFACFLVISGMRLLLSLL